MTKKKQEIVTEEKEVVEQAPVQPDVLDEETKPNEPVTEADEPVEEKPKKTAQQQTKFEHGIHTIDIEDPENVKVYGGPVIANLGKVTEKQARAWLDEKSWENVE